MATFAAWCRPRNDTRVRPRPASSTSMPSRSHPSSGAPATSVNGTPSRRARRRTTTSPSPSAPVTARSPRSMIAAFSRAIAVTVLPRRSVWSRSTLVTTATPPSQAWVASSRPPSPTSTSARSGPASANRANTTAVRSSNSVGSPYRRATAPLTPSTCSVSRREVVGTDRPAVDLDPFAVGDEMRLGGRTHVVAGRSQGGVGQGQDAALAVGPGDQCAADGALRVAQRGEQGTRPAKPEPHAEPPARFELPDRRLVVLAHPRDGHGCRVTPGTALPRRRCTG